MSAPAAQAPVPARVPRVLTWWTARIPGPAGADLAAALLLALLVAGLFWPLIAGRVLYDRDIGVRFHAQAEAFFIAVRQRSWPVWNPFPSFGEPLLANANAQVLYPPTWLLMLIPPALYYSGYVIAHVL